MPLLCDPQLTNLAPQPQLAYDMVKWAMSIAVSIIDGPSSVVAD